MSGSDEPVPALRLEGIAKNLGYLPVLRGVSCTIPRGQAVALVGPNGAGKTTLLRVLSTVLRPTAGEGWVFGRSLLTERNLTRGSIGYLGHGSGLYDGLTVKENLWLSGKLYEVDPIAEKVQAAIGRARLEAYEHTMVRHLSKGLTRRLALERALLHEPPLLLLDEPFDGLDPEAQRRLAERLSHHRKQGGTSIVVTHDLALAQTLCDRALVLGRGVIRHDVDPSQTPLTPELLGMAVAAAAVEEVGR